jgi:hypothetical protein
LPDPDLGEQRRDHPNRTSDTPRLAIMVHEHTALCLQFAHAFGNDSFEPLSPPELMIPCDLKS